MFSVFSRAAAEGDEPFDEPAQKVADLVRARQAGGRSPDRIVVVYGNAPGRDNPQRQRLRQQIAGRLVQADAVLGRDVIRIAGGDADRVAQRVRTLPGVVDAYPDQIATATLSVNDTMLGQQWAIPKIQAPTAWDVSQGTGVTVAVLDCGVHASHPDLSGKIILERNFTGAATADDRCNHGTHVAGTIAAVTNNGLGVAGVASNAQLMSGKVLDDGGSGFFSDIDAGIQWAADNGARVISLSLGADIACPSGTQSAVTYAWNKGAMVVAAAGNSGRSGAAAPANCANAIGVAASDANDARASFSNYGSETDVAAPGVSILSTINPDLNSGALYGYFNGTSMATPHASGVAALIWATSYGSSPAAVRDRLFTTADRVAGTGTFWTYGRINAAAAVAGAGSVAATSTSVPATNTPTPTNTAIPTSSPQPTNTPTATNTPQPTNTPAPTQPPATPTNTPTGSNDAFANAWSIALPGTATGSNVGMTTQSGEQRPCASISRTVWYRFVPSASGTVTADTIGSAFDTVLAAYSGTSLAGLTLLTCNDDISGSRQSQVQFAVTAGQTYYLQLGGYGNGSRGNYILHVTAGAGAAASPLDVRGRELPPIIKPPPV